MPPEVEAAQAVATEDTSTEEPEEEAPQAVAAEDPSTEEPEEEAPPVEEDPAEAWTGPILTPSAGRIQGPSGEETYYNLPMAGVIEILEAAGIYGEYWIREDGVKMYGDYIMIAANLDIRPRGAIVQTSLGSGIVCDTGEFAKTNIYQIDIAVNW